MSLWLPRTSHAILSRSSSRIRVRSSIILPIHRRLSTNQTNASNHHAVKPNLPTQKDPTQAPLMARAWKKVKHEAAHYWNGTKLLVSEVRISSRLQWKILQGETLTRRERRQVLSILKSCQKPLH